MHSPVSCPLPPFQHLFLSFFKYVFCLLCAHQISLERPACQGRVPRAAARVRFQPLHYAACHCPLSPPFLSLQLPPIEWRQKAWRREEINFYSKQEWQGSAPIPQLYCGFCVLHWVWMQSTSPWPLQWCWMSAYPCQPSTVLQSAVTCLMFDRCHLLAPFLPPVIPPQPPAEDVDRYRRRFNMRMLVPGRPVKETPATPPPVPTERPTYREKFIPPELSMWDYFVAKVRKLWDESSDS